MYYENIFPKFNNDIKTTWKTKLNFGIEQKEKKILGNNITSNKMFMVNKFNLFFTNVVKTE